MSGATSANPSAVRLGLEFTFLYATGEWTLSSLHKEIGQRGLRSRRGKRKEMSKSKFAEMLHNRAYIGKVKWDGVEYDGTHEPLISEEL